MHSNKHLCQVWTKTLPWITVDGGGWNLWKMWFLMQWNNFDGSIVRTPMLKSIYNWDWDEVCYENKIECNWRIIVPAYLYFIKRISRKIYLYDSNLALIRRGNGYSHKMWHVIITIVWGLLFRHLAIAHRHLKKHLERNGS